MATKPRIAVLMTLDSKADVARYVVDRIAAAGATPTLIDLSLRPHDHGWAQLSGEDVAHAAGESWESLAAKTRVDAADAMTDGGCTVVEALLAEGDTGGIIAVGGANGAAMACGIMRGLPVALPKVMVTPVAATAAVQWYVAQSDIVMMPTIGDISLNRVTRAVIDNAANAIVGMARGWSARDGKARESAPLIGLTTFGNLQPAVDCITTALEAKDFEVIQFHASGPGGQALESLAAQGELTAVIDLTTSELADALTGGVYSAGQTRLTAAGAAGLAQVVAPGCLDFTNWWVGEVPARYADREFYQYNAEILLMRTNAEEYAVLGRTMGERLAAAKGPVLVLVPTRGYSQMTERDATDVEGAVTAPWHRPDLDRVFTDALADSFDRDRIRFLDLHINDPAFAAACVDALDGLAVKRGDGR